MWRTCFALFFLICKHYKKCQGIITEVDLDLTDNSVAIQALQTWILAKLSTTAPIT
jgi:hypothetical protein